MHRTPKGAIWHRNTSAWWGGVAHSILVIIYHLLTEEEDYKELGPSYFAKRNRVRSERRTVRLLEQSGYKVELQPMATSASQGKSPPSDETT